MLPRSLPPLLLALCLAAPASSQEPPNPAPPVVPTPTNPVPDPVGGGGPPSQAAPGTQPPPAGATPPATAPAPAAPAPSGPPGAGPDRIDFVLNFPEDQGGGSAAGSSGNLEYVRENYAVLTGGVQIRYQDVDLK